MANESETGVRQRRNIGIKKWELSPEPATFASSNKWSNYDMDVVPGEYDRAQAPNGGGLTEFKIRKRMQSTSVLGRR